jgi:hypothetical protein
MDKDRRPETTELCDEHCDIMLRMIPKDRIVKVVDIKD